MQTGGDPPRSHPGLAALPAFRRGPPDSSGQPAPFMDYPHNIILLGRPGSGKSSLGRAYAEEHGFLYLSSGDVARELAATDHHTATALMQGQYASESAMRMEIKMRLGEANTEGMPVVLDGFPRMLAQLYYLEQLASELDQDYPGHVFVHVECPYLICLRRLIIRGRDTDQADAVEVRFRNHENDTKPLITALQEYGECPSLMNVGPIEENVKHLKGLVARYSERDFWTKSRTGDS